MSKHAQSLLGLLLLSGLAVCQAPGGSSGPCADDANDSDGDCSGGVGNAGVAAGVAQADANVRRVGGCQIFPGDGFWNVTIDTLPRHPYADDYEAYVAGMDVHPDFGGYDYGIVYDVVPATQAPVPVAMDYLRCGAAHLPRACAFR